MTRVVICKNYWDMEFSAEQEHEVQMIYQNGDSEGLLVTLVGRNLYRLESSSFFDEAHYHDVVEAEPQPNGTLRFIRLVTPSGLKTMSCILPRFQTESPKLTLFLDEVMAVGGHWERIFGGVLILSLPPAEHDRIVAKLENLFREVQSLSVETDD